MKIRLIFFKQIISVTSPLYIVNYQYKAYYHLYQGESQLLTNIQQFIIIKCNCEGGVPQNSFTISYQESQTETPYENLSTDSQSTQQQHRYSKDPYIQKRPIKLIFPCFTPADYLSQNGQNIQRMLLYPNIQLGQRQQNIMIEILINRQKNQYILSNADGCRRSVTVQCFICQSRGITRVKYEISDQGICYVFLLLITLPILFWLPYYMRECQEIKSFCYRCHRQIDQALGRM